MELETYICNSCGRTHETCICFDVEEEFHYYMDYIQSQYDNSEVEKNKYPKFNGDDVEISEGIIVSKNIYNKYYK